MIGSFIENPSFFKQFFSGGKSGGKELRLLRADFLLGFCVNFDVASFAEEVFDDALPAAFSLVEAIADFEDLLALLVFGGHLAHLPS